MPNTGDFQYAIECDCGERINLYYKIETLCQVCNNTFIVEG